MRVVLSIDSHVSFDYRKLKREDSACFVALKKSCTYHNPDYYKLQRLGFATTRVDKKTGKTIRVRKIIRTFTEKNARLVLPRGALSKIRKILKEHGHKISIDDARLSFPPIMFNSKIELRAEQVAPVETMIRKEQCLVRGPCAVGKTVMLLEAIARAKQPALVIMNDTNLQKQWLAEAMNPKLLNLRRSEIGGIGGIFKSPKLGKLNLCMQQSLWKEKGLEFFREHVGFVGLDEVQNSAARTPQVAVNFFPAKFRIGVSADEKRKDQKEFLIYDTFGKVAHRIEDRGLASRLPARIVLVPTRFVSDAFEERRRWNDLLNDMADDEDRNAIILSCVRKSLAKKKVCLILTERREHALFFKFALRDHNVGFLIGNVPNSEIAKTDWPNAWKEFMYKLDNDKEFNRVKKLGEQRKLDVIIGTQKGNVGINIRTIDHGFVTTPTGNNLKLFNQQIGRIERDHDKELKKLFGPKSTPKLYYFWDVKMDKTKDAGNNIIKHYPGVSVLKKERE